MMTNDEKEEQRKRLQKAIAGSAGGRKVSEDREWMREIGRRGAAARKAAKEKK